MRNARTSFAVAAAIGLLASSALAVAGQGDEASWPQTERNIRYGTDSPRQVIHAARLEPRDEPRPAVVVFHGGGLIWGSPEQDADLMQLLINHGYVTFLAGYRLFDQFDGANPWPAQIDDAQRAVRWIRAHADEFGVDPDRLCALGFSSGGQLAGLLGTTEAAVDPDPELIGVSSRVDCVVSLAGDMDLTIPNETDFWNDLLEQILGGTFAEQPELYKAASPAYNVDVDTVPFLIVHGTEDLDVPVEASRSLAAVLTDAGREVTYEELPLSHFGVRDADRTWELIAAFLADQLSPET